MIPGLEVFTCEFWEQTPFPTIFQGAIVCFLIFLTSVTLFVKRSPNDT